VADQDVGIDIFAKTVPAATPPQPGRVRGRRLPCEALRPEAGPRSRGSSSTSARRRAVRPADKAVKRPRSSSRYDARSSRRAPAQPFRRHRRRPEGRLAGTPPTRRTSSSISDAPPRRRPRELLYRIARHRRGRGRCHRVRPAPPRRLDPQSAALLKGDRVRSRSARHGLRSGNGRAGLRFNRDGPGGRRRVAAASRRDRPGRRGGPRSPGFVDDRLRTSCRDLRRRRRGALPIYDHPGRLRAGGPRPTTCSGRKPYAARCRSTPRSPVSTWPPWARSTRRDPVMNRSSGPSPAGLTRRSSSRRLVRAIWMGTKRASESLPSPFLDVETGSRPPRGRI
jgi:hypothetical protein